MRFTRASNLLCLAPLARACLLPEERANGLMRRDVDSRQTRGSGKAIGTGDRFKGGSSFPRGIGSGNATDMTTILNVDEIASALEGLSKQYGFDTFTTPYTTYEGASISGGAVGGKGTCDEAFGAYLNGQIHARERGSADNVLYFISDLLYAQEYGTGLTYGDKTYTNADVTTALGVGVVFLPLSNPDGVAYDYSSNSCWRKNRNPAAATSGVDATIGVDLNRNFDFVWDLDRWAPSVSDEVASDTPRSEVFHGASAFSEPETKSMKWVLDTYSKVSVMIDLHSYAGDILYSWGSDTDQTANTYMNFQNTTYDSVRGITSDSSTKVYGEYIPKADSTKAVNLAKSMQDEMNAATDRGYTAMQSAYLYPTSGASDDYAFSRHLADTSLNKVYAYTIEFGFGNNKASCPFYPTDDQYILNMQEVSVGFMELLLGAADLGLGGSNC
ncbi:hypothetical protein F5Y15DRAFT_272308 [Xylariaceae sp. FL0016]|nr:hypothetical protein F5Y15DRAFT_272308 [Xylariaceae sp. FL0016]